MKKISFARDSDEPVPDFDLPSTKGGARLRLADFRQKDNLVLYFFDGWDCDYCRRHLRSLKQHRDLFVWLDARALAIARRPLAELATGAVELEPDITLLADVDGRVTEAFVQKGGDGALPLLVIADRFGALFSWMQMEPDEEIDFQEVENTLLFIATQCPECGRPEAAL